MSFVTDFGIRYIVKFKSLLKLIINLKFISYEK